MKRVYRLVAVLCFASLFAAALPSTAWADATTPTTPTTPEQETFRTSLNTYLHNLGGALSAAAQNPQTKAAIEPKLQDNQTALASAQQQVASLTGPQLDAMQGILGQSSAWQQQPTVVQQDLAPSATASGAPAPAQVATPPPGFVSDCTANVGGPKGLFYAYWAAAQVASAANAVASGMPDGVDFAPALIIAAVIFGVANGIAIVLASNLALAADCSQAVANANLADGFPVDANGNRTPGSSQISVNTLTVLAGGIETVLNSIQTTTNTITSTLTNVINSLATAQGTSNTIQTVTTDLQARTDALLTSVGTPGDTTTGSANGLANTINAREDTILANTDTFQALSLRAEIERNLSSSPTPAVALFALPKTQGGYIETVRDIVTSTVQAELAAGQSVGQAQANLAGANANLAAGKFSTAFGQYAQAYQQAAG